MKSVSLKSLFLILFTSSNILFGQEELMEIESIWEVSESEDEIWVTCIDEKQIWWWLLYRGYSSDIPEHRNTISIGPAPLGENSMVPMIPLDKSEEEKVLSMIRLYLTKTKNSESNEIRVLKRILSLKEKQPNKADDLTDESSPQP